MICETKNNMIIVREYKKEDYNQLYALLQSYNYVPPFYVSMNRRYSLVYLINLKGYIEDNKENMFEPYEWQTSDLDEIIKKRSMKQCTAQEQDH